MSADVSRVVALGQVVELRKKASQAKRKSELCDNFSDRLIELRKVRDLETLADEAIHRG